MSQRYQGRSRSRDKQRLKQRQSQKDRQRQKYKEKQIERDRQRGKYKEKYKIGDRQQRSHSPQQKLYKSSDFNRPKQALNSKQYKDLKRQQERSQQETKVLCIDQVNSAVLSQLERKMIDTSILVGTSVPDQVQIREGIAYVKYPSIQVSSSIYKYLKGIIFLADKQFKIKYWPIKQSDINILYDWYCEKCDYKNFARRGKCHQCDNQKNANCRLNYGSQFVSFNTNKRQEIDDSINCSLMIRGPIITEVEEEVLMNIFEAFAPIKDIRMIRNKVTGGNKDFAFIEFFTPQEAAFALKKANTSYFNILGQKVTVMYSKTKQDDQFFSRPYDKERRGPPPIRRQTKITDDTPNYYLRQRQLEIQQEKKRPVITLEQLKEKRQSELKKTLPQQKEMSEQQNQRRKAQMLAKQWQKELKTQSSSMYVCCLCKRKFRSQDELKDHSKYSEIHKYRLGKLEKQKLVL